MTLDAQILSALRQAGPDGIGAATLALRLRQESAVLSQRVSELRDLGYEIEATPHFGFRLVGVPDLLRCDCIA